MSTYSLNGIDSSIKGSQNGWNRTSRRECLETYIEIVSQQMMLVLLAVGAMQLLRPRWKTLKERAPLN
jgi:hypothetical protein